MAGSVVWRRGRVAIATLALAGAGIYGGVRWRRVERRRAELNADYAVTMAQLRQLHEARLTQADALARSQAATRAMRHTVHTLWQDRLERYSETNADLHGYLAALPEALGALHGLTSHYAHLSQAARDLVGFDVAALKLHSMALLLDMRDGPGRRAAAALRHLFVAEPLVQAVGASLVVVVEAASPSSSPPLSSRGQPPQTQDDEHERGDGGGDGGSGKKNTTRGREETDAMQGTTTRTAFATRARPAWPVSLRECDETFAYCMAALRRGVTSAEATAASVPVPVTEVHPRGEGEDEGEYGEEDHYPNTKGSNNRSSSSSSSRYGRDKYITGTDTQEPTTTPPPLVVGAAAADAAAVGTSPRTGRGADDTVRMSHRTSTPPLPPSPPLPRGGRGDSGGGGNGGGVWSEVIGEVVRCLRASEASPFAAPSAPRKQKEEEEGGLVQRERNRLHSVADVAAAVTFVEELLRQLSPNGTANVASSPSSSSSSSLSSTSISQADAMTQGGMPAQTTRIAPAATSTTTTITATKKTKKNKKSVEEEESVMAGEEKAAATAATTTTVPQALQALRLWRHGACVFLAQAQAREALRCYDALLVLTMTHVNEEVV